MSFDLGHDTSPVIPAATVVLVRDTPVGIETLMLRKNAKLAFGGMWVFPGGRIDPVDGDGEEGARNAAVREALEEADLTVDPSTLAAFHHWTPPSPAPKRFATWFFLAPAPPVHDVTIDGGEIHEHVWAAPGEALARHGAGEIELAPPTWVCLHLLADHDTVESAMAWARGMEVEHFHTVIAKNGDGDLVAIWHGDAGYESHDPDAPGPRHRLVMSRVPEHPWHYERDTT